MNERRHDNAAQLFSLVTFLPFIDNEMTEAGVH